MDTTDSSVVITRQPRITFKTTLTDEHGTKPLIHPSKTEVIRIPGVPDGLECLLNVDTIIVDQSKSSFKKFTSDELKSKNKFMILDKNYKKLFCIIENDNSFRIFTYGKMRELNIDVQEINDEITPINISTKTTTTKTTSVPNTPTTPTIPINYDYLNNSNTILKLHSPLRGFCCCLFNCISSSRSSSSSNNDNHHKNYLEMKTSKGYKIGKINLIGYYLRPKLNIENENGEIVFTIIGPLYTGKCWVDNVFRIYHISGDEIGKIIGKWSGCTQECLTDFDLFQITFPKNLDISLKALIIGACIFIDYTFYHWNSLCLGIRNFYDSIK